MSGQDEVSRQDEGLRREVAALRASRRRSLRRALVALAVSAVLLPIWRARGEDVRRWVRGEIDLRGTPRYEPATPPDPEALRRVDFERVHTHLIPSWTVALGRSSSPYWRERADARYQALASELAPDPNLSSLWSSVRWALTDDPLERAHRLDYWLWAYNDYLDDNGIDWRLEASLTLGRTRPVFHAMAYRVLSDTRSAAGHRLRLLARADRLRAQEGWLGHAGRPEDGAMVLMRRVLHFTVRHVWPGLHPALDGRRPAAERSWLPYLREELRGSLDQGTYRLLSETAEDQQALIEIAAEVRARAECGSRLSLGSLPYNGLSRRRRRAVLAALERSRERPQCPEITLEEAALLVGASERLSSTEGLAEAVERLTMRVAHSVAAHELRHLADGDELACPGCPEGLEGVARDEVSAYLATFATEGIGYTALFQACATPRGPGLHGQALQAVLDALLPLGCEGPTLHGLHGYAAELERRLFGERDRVDVPADLPARVALLR